MTWMNILKKACKLCFLGAVTGLLLFKVNMAQAACKGIIFVGDSRTVGMAKVDKECIQGKSFPRSVDCPGTDGNYWYAKEGVSFSYLSGGISKINSVLANYDKIVIALGANDLGDPNANATTATQKAQQYINSLKSSAPKWIAAGKKVYFSLVTPVDEALEAKNNYHVKNSNIRTFNNAIKNGLSGTGIGIIDASGSVGSNNYSDGIHYKSYTNILNSVYTQACAGGDGKKGEDTSSGSSNSNSGKSDNSTSSGDNSSGNTKANSNSGAQNHDVKLSGKGNCASSESTKYYANNDTCKTVQNMKNAGSHSSLAAYGNECSTSASACKSSAIQSVSFYRDRGDKSCFQGMPIARGSITSVVGMRPVEIGAASSSCVLDQDTGIKMRQHRGMDVGAECGTTLEAPADGEIIDIRNNYNSDGSGKYIKIRHKMNPNSTDAQTNCAYYYTVFYHLRTVSATGTVKKGQKIGEIGNGNKPNWGCHMHMEIHKCSVDSEELLNPLCSNNENLCNDKSGVSATSMDPDNSVGSGSSGNGVQQNPHEGKKEDCSLFDKAECQKEPKASGCPTKTKTKEQCEKRNEAIDKGGEFCQTVKPGEGKANVAGSCIVKTVDNSSGCNSKTGQKSIPQDITNAIDESAKKYNIPPLLLAGIINVESIYNPNAQNSDTTAAGLGQILQGSWHNKYFNCDEYGTFNEAKYNARSNVMCMGKILNSERARLSKNFGNLYDEDLLIYAYFQGSAAEKAVQKYGADWKNHLVDATSTNTSGDNYLSYAHCHMNNIATKNGCSSQGGEACESFAVTDSYGGSGSLFGDAYRESGDKMSDFQTDYECNIASNTNSVEGCLFCDLFKTIFNASSKVARQCHAIFSDALVPLVLIGLAISIAYLLLPYMSNMTVQDPYKLVNNIIQRIFIVLVIVLLLKMNVTEFFDMFITPIFTTGMKLAELAISTEYTKELTQNTFDNIDGSGLPKEMAIGMLRAIYAVQVRLEQLWALGSNSICIAFYVKSYHHYPIFPHFGYLLTGVFMMITGVVFMLIYPFLLIDSVLQFAIASAILPIAIAASAFPITRKYINLMKVVNIFMNAMFIFIFLTIVMFILLSGIDEAVRPHIEKAYKDSSASGLFEIKEIGWYTQTFIKIIFFLFLGKAVLEDIPNFASSFGEAFSYGQSFGKPDMGIGRKIGGTAVGAATNVAKTVGGTVWKGTKTVGRGAKSFIGAAASEGRRTYLINKTRRKASALAATAAAGTATAAGAAWVSGRTWYGRKVQRRVTTDAQGNAVLETRKRSLIGNKRIINQDDGNMSITKKMNKDGSMTETYNIKTPYGKNLINADGTKNKDAMDYLAQSGLSKDAANKIMLNQLIKERLSGVKRGMGEETFRDNSFISEQVISSVDAQGREVFEVRRVGKDGYINVFKMTKGQNRDLVEYERIDKKGKAQKWSSDGVIQKKEKAEYNINQDGTLKNDIDTTINGVSMRGLKTSADGKLLDKNGNILGQISKSGAVIDVRPEIIGTIEDRGWGMYGNVTINGAKLDDFMMKDDDPTGIYDKNNKLIGHVSENGNIIDANKQVIGTAEKGQLTSHNSTLRINGAEISDWHQKDGLIFDKDDNIVGQILENGNIAKVTGQVNNKDLLYGDKGQVLGKRTINNTVIDQNGNVTGFVNDNGTITNSRGQIVGTVSEEEQRAFDDLRKVTSVEFSNAKAYKGVKIFDNDGRRARGMENEELMFSDNDLQSYQYQMNRYGDVLNHTSFGR